MNWWNLGGMNPKFKDFLEKHPEKTVIGIGWAFYWRFFVLAVAIEIILLFIFLILSFIL